MEHFYKDGKIVLEGKLFEEAKYNVSNEKISVTFDGKGATVGYALANEKEFMTEGYLVLFRNGKPVDVYTDKTVEMLGRCQNVYIDLGDAALSVSQFLDSSENGVFVSYLWESEASDDILRIGIIHRGSSMRGMEFSEDKTLAYNESRVYCANIPFTYEEENFAVYTDLEPNVRFETFFSYGAQAEHAREVVKNYHSFEEKRDSEVAAVKCPEGLSQEQRAMFYSCYYCSLENYKVKGDYKAFMAGHHYLLPMRSYYRDSYYTVLPMYREHADKIRNQIITLCRGIGENGECPSAVKWDYSQWWGNHYDSPSFLAMMLYDYVKYTKDSELLYENVGSGSVLQQAERAVEALSYHADETGLLYKEGKYNKRDWADEVNRTGYVTYNQLLYARALYSLSKLCDTAGNTDRSCLYMKSFEKVKQAINDILWDDELGYYINFKDREYTETNLSVDTVFAALFDIADKEKAVRMLKNMERILETKNNSQQGAGDFGVMCVYPFYGRPDSAYCKSSQPFYYHNGANWPYLGAVYACAKRKYGMEYRYALESWFDYNVRNGNYTPVEFFSPPQKDGSLLQAWSGAVAFVLDEEISRDFYN